MHTKAEENWEYNIKMDLSLKGYDEDEDWIQLRKGHVRWWYIVNTVVTIEFHKSKS